MDYGKNQHATLPVVSVIYNIVGVLYNLYIYILIKNRDALSQWGLLNTNHMQHSHLDSQNSIVYYISL